MRTEGVGAAARVPVRDPGVARRFGEALARASSGTRSPRRAGSVRLAVKGIAGAPRRPGTDAPWRRSQRGRSPGSRAAPPIHQEQLGSPAALVTEAPTDPLPLAPAALERIAVVARAQRQGTTVELSIGRDLSVHVACGAAGVDVVLDASAALARWAEAELPRLLAALRARGVTVAGAVVRRTRQARRAALTASRGSATNAPSSPAGGTVAKW